MTPRRGARSPRSLLAAGLAVAAIGGLGACGRDGFEDRTAVVSAGERTVRFQLDACGLDGSTLYVVGRSDAGEVLQVVVGLGDDGETGTPAATGATFDVGPDVLGAFGAEAWERRDGAGRAPGHVSWARLRGARIQLAGEAEPVDDEAQVRTAGDAEAVRFDLDARCDERDDG